MKSIQNILETFRIPLWDELPEIELTSKQFCEYVNNILEPISLGEEILTRSRIQNYIKLDYMPKPDNRYYSREHIAIGIILCLYREMMSLEEISKGIELQKMLN